MSYFCSFPEFFIILHLRPPQIFSFNGHFIVTLLLFYSLMLIHLLMRQIYVTTIISTKHTSHPYLHQDHPYLPFLPYGLHYCIHLELNYDHTFIHLVIILDVNDAYELVFQGRLSVSSSILHLQDVHLPHRRHSFNYLVGFGHRRCLLRHTFRFKVAELVIHFHHHP